jgi:RHS repeat-associated protein
MQMPGRKYQAPNSSKTRYGFNGKENDNDVKGEGNQQNYGMRIYDPRLGRFLSEDPLVRKFPMLTPYQFASNNPIQNIDIDGLEGGPANQTGLEYVIRIMDVNGIIKNDPDGTKYNYNRLYDNTVPRQDIFMISGTVTKGTFVKDQSGPCCPTIIRTVTYQELSKNGVSSMRLVGFDEKIVGPRNPPSVVAMPPQNQIVPVPANFNTASGNALRRPGGPDPTRLDGPGQAAINTAAANFIPTTTVSQPVAGVNAAGIATSSVTTTTTNSVITVDISSGFSTPPPAANRNALMNGRMNTIVNLLQGVGVPASNIIRGNIAGNNGAAVNLNVTTTTTQSTTTTTNCPSSSGCSPPPTDVNQTWQQKN